MGYGLGRADAVKAAVRTVVLASADTHFRARLKNELTAMRWQVREACGGAEALEQLEREGAEAMVLDHALPDLDVGEFAVQMRRQYPVMDLLRVNAGGDEAGTRSPRRNELMHALRRAQREECCRGGLERLAWGGADDDGEQGGKRVEAAAEAEDHAEGEVQRAEVRMLLPEMVGGSAGMVELARLVRLVAPRSAAVLIEGETGTGKELVAKAVHLLSVRASKPFVVLNCAAIPEALLEAELFGHTRGAFTGAVQSRMGRIEAAHGGTLFLDEIGEMPLALQAKMLRFLESGELQRVGDNEMLRVDVRVVAASHQPLRQRAMERAFRLDLYHRLAVFPVSVPALRDRMEDVLPLAAYLLGKMGEEMPVKALSAGAAKRLIEHDWPGNVRELAHVLERAAILAEDRKEIAAAEIWF